MTVYVIIHNVGGILPEVLPTGYLIEEEAIEETERLYTHSTYIIDPYFKSAHIDSFYYVSEVTIT